MSRGPAHLRRVPILLVRVAWKLAVLALLIALAILVAWAVVSRGMGDLEPWHTVELDAEFVADDADEGFDFVAYLELEDRLFAQLDREVYAELQPTPLELRYSRYAPGGANDPRSFPVNWNHSYEHAPDEVRGGALLIHGLTDSPYSLRHVAEILRARGFHVVGLRLPGHGTAPSGLTTAVWEDWLAATRIAARHVKEKVAGRGPLWIVGYSTGGALALMHALESLEDSEAVAPDQLVVFSAAVGVTPFAAVAHTHVILSWMPWFEKFKWLSIEPEYDPFKYVSFPKNAADQSHELSSALQDRLRSAQESGRIAEMSPVLAFQSLMDDTVLMPAVVDDLFARVQSAGNELVLFDINRAGLIDAFVGKDPGAVIQRLEADGDLPYRLTVIANDEDDTPAVVARSRPPHSRETEVSPIGLSWPPDIYSLSHIALPFPLDDPISGLDPGERSSHGLHLGNIQLRGERRLLVISATEYMRLRSNPFFPWVEQRLATLAEAKRRR